MGPSKSKAGRKPHNGIAKTSTQRSRDIRERDSIAIAEANCPDDYLRFSTRLLLKAIKQSVKDCDSRRTTYIAAELVKRSEQSL